MPAVIIGNLALGGTGKTPHTLYLCTWLAKNFKVGVLSRGYGRKTTGFRWVEQQSPAEEVGDEPLIYKRSCPHAVVAVCENRGLGVRTMAEHHSDMELLLLDDAFQHRAVEASCNLVLTTFHQPFWEDMLLPAGNLRDVPEAISRASAVIVTKMPDFSQALDQLKLPALNCPVFFSRLRYCGLRNFHSDELIPLEHLRSFAGAVLLTALANDTELFNDLRIYHPKLYRISLQDHSSITSAAVESARQIISKFAADKGCVILTTKDAVKLTAESALALSKFSKIFIVEADIEFYDEPKFRQFILHQLGIS